MVDLIARIPSLGRLLFVPSIIDNICRLIASDDVHRPPDSGRIVRHKLKPPVRG
jgi:hypothetical protein